MHYGELENRELWKQRFAGRWPVKNGAKMKKTGSRKSVKIKWRPFSVMIVHVGAGRLLVFFFPVKVIWLII